MAASLKGLWTGQVEQDKMTTKNREMYMRHGIVTAGHEKTAQAAQRILREGGNAFDAIVAAGFAACAAEPVFASLGGGGFLLAHTASGVERLYDFFVQTPRELPDPQFLDFYPIHADFGPTTQEFHIGLASIAAPGMIAGMFAVHENLGSLPIRTILAPAVELCREGITVNAFQHYLFDVVKPIYSGTEEARKTFGSSSDPQTLVREGDLLKLPELAETLEALGREGPELFYEGELAHRLAKQCSEGGILSLEDLVSYRVFQRNPFEFFYRKNRMLTNPPPSCGGILIAFTFALLEKLKPPFKFGTAEDLSMQAQAMEWTNKARMDVLSREPDWERAAEKLFQKKFLRQYLEQIPGRSSALRGTTHLNVIDGEGNVAAMSISNGEGCGHMLKGTGIMLNNMLGEEDINPSGFFNWLPDQRMTSMMAPTLLFQPDQTMVAAGSGGSNRIRTAVLQVLRNLIDYGMAVGEAVQAPRIHYERGLLSLEPGFSEKEVQKLFRDFPKHRLWQEKNLFFGGVHTVTSHPLYGFKGAGDPRRFGVCLEV